MNYLYAAVKTELCALTFLLLVYRDRETGRQGRAVPSRAGLGEILEAVAEQEKNSEVGQFIDLFLCDF